MVTECKHVMVPFFSTHQKRESRVFDKMKVEEWPIIQAYAVEDYGRYVSQQRKHLVI